MAVFDVSVTTQIREGDHRTFGPHGPAYQVLAVDVAQGTARIRVLHSGEELDAYPLAHVANDPEAT